MGIYNLKIECVGSNEYPTVLPNQNTDQGLDYTFEPGMRERLSMLTIHDKRDRVEIGIYFIHKLVNKYQWEPHE